MFRRTFLRAFGVDTAKSLAWNTQGVNRHGFPWPPDCNEASLQHAEQFRPGPNDVFVTTYPKSGTTWTVHILYQLATKGDFSFANFADVYPFWESVPGVHVSLDAAKEPRIIKTHAPLSLIPSFVNGDGSNGPVGKYVYVVRDPRDVIVSFYKHSLLTNALQFDRNIDAFFAKFLQGELYYGSWFDHVADACKYRNHPNTLLITYEELKRDLSGTVKKLIDFTGSFDIAPEVYKEIEPRFKFEWMREKADILDFTLRYPNRSKGNGQFFRNGKVGDWANYLNEQQLAQIRDKYQEFFGGNPNAAWLPYKI